MHSSFTNCYFCSISSANARTFVSDNLKCLIDFKRDAQDHNTTYLVDKNPILIFNKSSIERVFDLHDVDGKERLPKATCERAIEFMGIRNAELDDIEYISKASFVQICSNALLRDIGM
ncbi:hypothetical protein HMI56_002145 [Coelomomyces lativittatus]|nr:hypothetical protein HMI56_002145 [Coelomomyces lativittatus]